MVLEKASDVDEVAKGMPGEQTEKAVAASDQAEQEIPQRPAGEQAAALSPEASEVLDGDPAATEDRPEEPDKA